MHEARRKGLLVGLAAVDNLQAFLSLALRTDDATSEALLDLADGAAESLIILAHDSWEAL